MSTEHPANYLTTCAGDSGQVQASLDEFLASMKEQLGGENPTELTISSGSITPTSGAHFVTAETGSSDALTTVVATNLMDGQLLLLWPAEGKTIAVNHEAGGAGQIHLNCSHDLDLDDTDNYVLLQRQGDDWYEAARMGDIMDPADMKRLEATDSGVKLSQEGDQIDLNKGSVKIDAEAGGADHTASGITMAMTADEAVAFGNVCYLKSNGHLEKANADSASTMPATFMALETITVPGTLDVLVQGVARDDSWSWTTGGVVYTSATAGGLTQTAPSGSGEYVQAVGLATNATRVLFAPEKTMVDIGELTIPVTELSEGQNDANNFIVTMDGGASASETGEGGELTGADLVATQVGSIPASVAGWRALNGTNQSFTLTSAAGALFASNTWALVMRVKDITLADGDRFATIMNTGTVAGMTLKMNSSYQLYGEVHNGTTWKSAVTSDSLQAGTEYWIAIWADGVNNFRVGFTTAEAMPTAYNDFESGKRATCSDYDGDLTGKSFNARHICAYNGSLNAACTLQGFKISKNGLA